MIRATVDITCPSCRKRARFSEPFAFVSAEHAAPDETRPFHKWGGWIVIERFPSQFPWVAPGEGARFPGRGSDPGQHGYAVLTDGLVQCGHCHVNAKHRLQWPEDAYWQWNIRGDLLWAWDRSHAEAILAFIEAAHRPSRRSEQLRHLPAHFLTAKVRGEVVGKMKQRLAETPAD